MFVFDTVKDFRLQSSYPVEVATEDQVATLLTSLGFDLASSPLSVRLRIKDMSYPCLAKANFVGDSLSEIRINLYFPPGWPPSNHFFVEMNKTAKHLLTHTAQVIKNGGPIEEESLLPGLEAAANEAESVEGSLAWIGNLTPVP